MSELHSLLYVSTAAAPVSVVEIEHILERAQARNFESGLTGVLLFDAGHFMQYVEGPAAGMSRVLAIIRASPLHSGIVELLREPIRARAFPEWAMAYRSNSQTGMSAALQQSELLVQRLEPDIATAALAPRLLSSFWRRGRSAPAF